MYETNADEDRPDAFAGTNLPATTSGADGFLLSDAEIAAFHRDGYVVVENITTPAEIEEMREWYDRLFASRRGEEIGDFFDTRAAEATDAPMTLPQMIWPGKYEPRLRNTALFRNAQAMAGQLVRSEARLVCEFAIMKPAEMGAATPWHQDEAFFGIGTDYDVGIAVWTPLQAATVENGCMQYVPGSHEGELYPHDSVGGDTRAHGLEMVPPFPQNAVAAQVPLGGAVLHHSRTIHYAGPNASSAPRRAYTLEFASVRRTPVMRDDFPWNRAKQSARAEKLRRSMTLQKRLRERLRRTRLRLGI